MKQKFQHQTLTLTKAVNNILKVYRTAEVDHKGYAWYAAASLLASELAREYGIQRIQACGVIAALSANKGWEENKRIARLFLAEGVVKHTATMGDKAWAILRTSDETEILEILNGQKISSFFLNIWRPTEETRVTIDRHAVAIAVGLVPDSLQMTDAQYRFFEDAYRRAASKVSILPHQMQAVTWVKWRVLKKQLA